MTFPPFSTTGIGSLPHTSADEAVRAVIGTFDIPFWPQLPALSFRELMLPQYSEGMPCVRMDSEKQSIWFERDEGEIGRFYETHGENARSPISEEYAAGLYAFVKAVRSGGKFLKGHITGPITFTLGLKDASGLPLYFDEELRQIALMLLQAKARWQIDLLGLYAEKVVVFIDEPILSALGSTSYLGVERGEALRLLTETADCIRAAGGIPGIHCCGRAEWPLLFETGIDILNFDAYEFGQTLAIYPEETRAFLEKGGYLAWGIVPTTEAVISETTAGLKDLFMRLLEALSKGIPGGLLTENIILSPSCGTGSRTMGETEKVFELLRGLKKALAS